MTERLEIDPKALASMERLRLVAGIGGAFAAAVLLAIHSGPILVLLGAFGLLLSAIWIIRALRARRRRFDPSQHYLEMDSAGFTLAEGPSHRRVLWEDVLAIRVDEDRLVVAVELKDAQTLAIEPRYRQISLLELAERLTRAQGSKALLE